MTHARRHFKAVIAVLAFLFLPCAPTLLAATPDQLGKVHFPTSCSSAVQPTIEKAVALLHSFEYQASEQTFADAAARDQDCAIAHWGKAMALYHQLWDFPSDKTLKEGHEDIERAQKLQSASPREQGF